MPSRSHAFTAVNDSRVKSGSRSARMAAAMSFHGTKTLSATTPWGEPSAFALALLSASYKIARAWLAMPIS
jgi:hypothetical protein